MLQKKLRIICVANITIARLRCGDGGNSKGGDAVKVATFNGTPFVLDLIRDGSVEMDIGENLDWIAHAMLDAEMRLLCGQEAIRDSKVPLRVFSAENVAEVGAPACGLAGWAGQQIAPDGGRGVNWTNLKLLLASSSLGGVGASPLPGWTVGPTAANLKASR